MSGYQGDDTTGFQSPAQDYIEPTIDLAKLLGLTKPGLYPVRVEGPEWRARGIFHGDLLIANAAADPKAGKVCVAFLHGEVVLATLTRQDDQWWLAGAGCGRAAARPLLGKTGGLRPAGILSG